MDLDQVFNIFDPVARVAVQDFFQQSAVQLSGKSQEAELGYQYLNPALSTSSRLFRELNRDTPVLEAFLVDSAKLVTTARPAPRRAGGADREPQRDHAARSATRTRRSPRRSRASRTSCARRTPRS